MDYADGERKVREENYTGKRSEYLYDNSSVKFGGDIDIGHIVDNIIDETFIGDDNGVFTDDDNKTGGSDNCIIVVTGGANNKSDDSDDSDDSDRSGSESESESEYKPQIYSKAAQTTHFKDVSEFVLKYVETIKTV